MAVLTATKTLGKAKNNEDKELTGYKYCVDSHYEYDYTQLNQNLGAARWMYNHYVAEYKDALDKKRKPIILTPGQFKKSTDCPDWLKFMDSLNLANVQIQFTEAIQRFFQKKAKFPKFKNKHDHWDSYTTNMVGGNIKLVVTDDGVFLKLPKIDQQLKLIYHRPIPENGVIKAVTVSHEPDCRYYVSILVATPKETDIQSIDPYKAIGLDMSLPKLYVDSNGNEADFEKPYRKNEERLHKEQRKLSHMVKGSKNYEKQRKKVAALHAKIKHQREDTLHKLSCKLTNDYDIIGIEDLDMNAIKQGLRFGKSASDNGWGNFTKMLSYKTERKGKILIRVDRWFPSSKTCYCCGYVHKELKLSDREYVCTNCGNVMKRDYQAAVNIRNEALRIYAKAMAA